MHRGIHSHARRDAEIPVAFCSPRAYLFLNEMLLTVFVFQQIARFVHAVATLQKNSYIITTLFFLISIIFLLDISFKKRYSDCR